MLFHKTSINQVKKPMNNDYLEIENADGMPGLVDSAIALDFLIGIKSGIKNYAIALTEVEDKETRSLIETLLYEQIDLHTETTELLMTKGWLHPYDLNEQFRIDRSSAQSSIQIANLDLFPGNTSRMGSFATPNY